MKTLLRTAALIGLLSSSSLFAASASAKHFTLEDDGRLSGVVGDTFVFIFNHNDAAKIKDDLKLQTMAKWAQKKICTNKDMREFVVSTGYKIMFVYPEEKEATVIRIDDCKGF